MAAALGALLLTSALAAPVYAMQAATPDAATKAAMDRRTSARAMLSSAIGRLATNSEDRVALLDAGRASIELEDYRAALNFLARAEKASPRDGAVKAALGSAMVHMESPTRALDYFGEAQLLGAPERLFLADRALARDLLGQQDAAQRDYQLALSVAPNDEVTRRYAVSLGISGDADRAIQLLTPQLRAQDRAAWRTRAMILAMNGRNGEATEIVNATMPAALAQNILPYLTQMDRLNPAQQAAAAHFGRFPGGQLGPPRKPVQIAAATPVPSPPAATGAKPRDRAKPVAAIKPSPTPPASSFRRPGPAYAERQLEATVSTPKPAPPPTTAPKPALTPAPAPVTPSPVTPAPSPALASASPPPSATPTPAAPTSAPIGPNPVQSSQPVGPGFSIADIGPKAPAPTASAAPSPTMGSTGAISADAPLASLAAIASSIEIPAEELAQADNAIGADTLAKLREDKRRADAAEDAKREKDAAAAKVKAETDAKAKAEAAEKKANPARIWVQIATGANARALATDFGKFAKKSPAVFKGKSGGTTEWGKTRRLLVGPFKDRKAAQDWLTDYKKAGGDGFLFNSEAGQDVDPLK